MKKIIHLVLFFACLSAQAADVKISQLPLGSAAATNINDSFPYVDSVNVVTRRLTLYDLANLPSLVAAFAPITNPTFTGTVRGSFTGPLTGNASTATAFASTPTGCAGGQYATGIAANGNLTCSAAGGGTWGSITGTLSSQTDLATALGLRLLASNNLSDLGSASSARTNLGLGSLATLSPTGSPSSSTYLRGDDTWATITPGVWGSITGTLSSQTDLNTALGLRLLASNNLSDLGSASAARTNLGLGNFQTFSFSALGDTAYGGASGVVTDLPGNTTTTKKFLTQTGTGSVSAAPGWNTISAADVPTLNQNTTGTAANVTGTVAIANGGTGQITASAALTALSPATTNGDTLGYVSGAHVRIPVGLPNQVLTSEPYTTALVAYNYPVGKNYIANSTFEGGSTTGWQLGITGTLTNGLPTGSPVFGSGASGNLSLTADTTHLVSGTTSMGYVSSAATTAGNMVASNAMSIDPSDAGHQLTFSFRYLASVNPTNGNFSGTSSNSYGVAVWDQTNSAWIPITSGAFCFNSITQNICSGTFQTNVTTASIRFIIYNISATTGALTLNLDDIFVGPQVVNVGTVRPPVGTVIHSASPTVPSGFLAANGAAVSRTVYASLFAAIGTTYGVGDGSTTFNLPNGQGTFVRGVGSQTIGGITYTGTAGTTAADMMQGHVHSLGTTLNQVVGSYYQNINSGSQTIGTQAATGNPASDGTNGTPRTGFETRPANISLYTYICYDSGTVASSDAGNSNVVFSASGTPTGTVNTSTNTAIWPSASILTDSAGGYNSTTGIYTFQSTADFIVNGMISISGTYASGVNSLAGVSTTCQTSSVIGQNLFAVSGIPYLQPYFGGIAHCRAGDTMKVTQTTNATSASYTSNANAWSIAKVATSQQITSSDAVHAYITSPTGGNSVGTSATAMIFTNKVKDLTNSYNSSTGVFLVPSNGRYEVCGYFASASQTIATTAFLDMNLYQNGSQVSELGFTPGTGGSQVYRWGGCDVISALTNDQLQIYTNATTATTLYSGGLNRMSFTKVSN